MAKFTTVSEHTLVLDNDEANVVYEALAFAIATGDLKRLDPKGKALNLRDTIGVDLDPTRYT
jgi:hypothetical protein